MKAAGKNVREPHTPTPGVLSGGCMFQEKSSRSHQKNVSLERCEALEFRPGAVHLRKLSAIRDTYESWSAVPVPNGDPCVSSRSVY